MLSKAIPSVGLASERGLEGSPCEVQKLLPVDRKNPGNSHETEILFAYVCVLEIRGCTAKWCVWQNKHRKKSRGLGYWELYWSLGSLSRNCCGSTQGRPSHLGKITGRNEDVWWSTPISTDPINGLTRNLAQFQRSSRRNHSRQMKTTLIPGPMSIDNNTSLHCNMGRFRASGALACSPHYSTSLRILRYSHCQAITR